MSKLDTIIRDHPVGSFSSGMHPQTDRNPTTLKRQIKDLFNKLIDENTSEDLWVDPIVLKQKVDEL